MCLGFINLMSWLDHYTGKPNIICAFRCFFFICRFFTADSSVSGADSSSVLPGRCWSGPDSPGISEEASRGTGACIYLTLTLYKVPMFFHQISPSEKTSGVFCQRREMREDCDLTAFQYWTSPLAIVLSPQFQKCLLLPISGALRHSFCVI